jgi:tRNA modification GTPase
VRICGSQAWAVVKKLVSPEIYSRLAPGRLTYAALHHPEDQHFLDEAIILAFKAPHSFTGEDIIELQCHGGYVMPRLVLEACLQAGATLALRGEFTRRALLNGKLSLPQAEALLDVIHAEGEALVKASSNALHQDTLGQRLQHLRDGLIGIQADIVAAMDYPEEVDEPERAELQSRLDALNSQIQAYTLQASRFRIMRDGLKVALVGKPNAGKSSLFNYLLVQERSIVTDIAGTTRDVVTERIQINGIPVTFLDTAGLREADNVVERLGVERSLASIQEADVLLHLQDAAKLAEPEDGLPPDYMGLEGLCPPNTPMLHLLTKWDCVSTTIQHALRDVFPKALPLSIVSGEGIELLHAWLVQHINQGPEAITTEAARFYLNQRQVEAMMTMQAHIADAKQGLDQVNIPLDMISIPLSDALYTLDTLLGEDTTEAVLDDVFSRFCVGK